MNLLEPQYFPINRVKSSPRLFLIPIQLNSKSYPYLIPDRKTFENIAMPHPVPVDASISTTSRLRLKY